MKKLIISLLLCCVFVLSACVQSGENLDNNSDAIRTISGVLSEQSVSSDYPGTHLLVADDLSVYPVSSIAIKLSDSKYIGNKVELNGSLNADTNLFTVTGVSILEILNDDDDSDDDSVEFIEYKNSDLGFRLKYYDDWALVEDGSQVSFVSPVYNIDDDEAMDTVLFDQFTFSYSASVFDSNQLDSPLLNYMATEYPEITDITDYLAKVGPDQLEAVKLENSSGGIDYFLYRNGLIYKASFLPFDALSGSDNLRIFKEMMSEYRFIGYTIEDSADMDVETEEVVDGEDIQDVSENLSYERPDINFTEFESSPYFFKSVYPASFYYAGSSSSDPNIRHHYGFSNEELSDDNELYSLDVVADLKPGTSFTIEGREIFEIDMGDDVQYYTQIDGQNYRVSGSKDFRDYMLTTLLSIESTD